MRPHVNPKDFTWTLWGDTKPPKELNLTLLFMYERAKVREDFIDWMIFEGKLGRDGCPPFSHWTGWEYVVPSPNALYWCVSPFQNDKHNGRVHQFGFYDRLLPCPFTGKKPVVDSWDDNGKPWKPRRFTLLSIWGQRHFERPQDLIDKWNTRVG